MDFIILAAVLAVGAGFIAPMVTNAVSGVSPSLTSNKFIALFVTGAALAATVWLAHEVLPREVK